MLAKFAHILSMSLEDKETNEDILLQLVPVVALVGREKNMQIPRIISDSGQKTGSETLVRRSLMRPWYLLA